MERFEKLWTHESVAFDSRAAAILQDITSLGMDQSRKKSIRTVLGMIQNYEVQTAKLIEQKLAESPALAEKAEQLRADGMAWGYARLTACEQAYGTEGFAKMLSELPQRKKIDAFAQGKLYQEEVVS